MRNAFLLAMILIAPALAGAQVTKLRVEVRNIEDKPVDRASVLVRFEGRSLAKLGKKMKTSWEMKTNQEGVVAIPPIPQGHSLVQVIATAYRTYGEEMDINEGAKTLTVDLTHPQPQHST